MKQTNMQRVLPCGIPKDYNSLQRGLYKITEIPITLDLHLTSTAEASSTDFSIDIMSRDVPAFPQIKNSCL